MLVVNLTIKLNYLNTPSMNHFETINNTISAITRNSSIVFDYRN